MNGFIRMSRYAGMREDLVQASGGNSSVKFDDGKMAIKASGYQLSDVSEKEGYSVVNREYLSDIFSNKEKRDYLRESDVTALLKEALIEGNRPSIETFLHSELSKYTLHTHPTVVNAITCHRNWIDELYKLFPNGYFVPYASPGMDLAKRYYEIVCDYAKKTQNVKEPFVIFLQNHGLVVSGNTADSVIEETERVVNTLSESFGISIDAYSHVTDIWKLFPEKIIWRVKDIDAIEYYRSKGFMWNFGFCPDCLVFLGKRMLEFKDILSKEDIQGFKESYGDPVLVGTGRDLYVISDSVKKARETESVLSFSAQVMRLNGTAECVFLDESEQDHLLNRDDEKYRKNVG